MNEKRILIIDDSTTQRLKLMHDLEKNGYLVLDFMDAKSALLEVDRGQIDLIISDVVMPEMDGYEFCKKIKTDPKTKDIPVILLTSLSDPTDVLKGLESKADNFIIKPYNEKELFSRISYVLLNKEFRGGGDNSSTMGIEIFLNGKKHTVSADRVQILDILFSTFENSMRQHDELMDAYKKLKKLSFDLRENNLQLEKLNEQKNNFLRIAAHDIRNPAHVILQSYELIKEEYGHLMNEENIELFDIIESASNSILQLLNDILDAAVIEGGEISLTYKEINITDLIKKTVRFNHSLAEKKNIKIEEVGVVDSVTINIDGAKIEQVLNNLISNAIKYSNPETKIEISVAKETKRVVVCVCDHGLGIPESQQDKLFKPFSTAGVKASGGEKSTGLGLYIVKQIIDLHKGELWFESEENVGSKFYFSLPISD